MYFHYSVLRCFPEKVGIKESIFLYMISRVKSVINSRLSNIYNIFISIIIFFSLEKSLIRQSVEVFEIRNPSLSSGIDERRIVSGFKNSNSFHWRCLPFD